MLTTEFVSVDGATRSVDVGADEQLSISDSAALSTDSTNSLIALNSDMPYSRPDFNFDDVGQLPRNR